MLSSGPPATTPAADPLYHTFKERFCRDCHLGDIDLMGALACSQGKRKWENCCKKWSMSLESCSLPWTPRDLVDSRGREVTLPATLRNEERKNGLEQLLLLIAMKWTKCFSQGDQQPKIIHLVYKWNRWRWTSQFLGNQHRLLSGGLRKPAGSEME